MESGADPTLLGFFQSPVGIAISWIGTIGSAILAIVSLLLFFREKRQSKLIAELVTRFEMAQQVAKAAESAAARKDKLEAGVRTAGDELEALRKDIEEKIPDQARAAFFRVAIPEIENQIVYLDAQRRDMLHNLAALNETPPNTDAIREILKSEIDSRVTSRRKLDESQALLSILTGITASLSALYFINFIAVPVSAIFGVLIANTVFEMGKRWANVYPEHRFARFIQSRAYTLLPWLIFGLIGVGTVGVLSYIYWRGLY